ncbi:transporter [Malaciobacter molluscorum LMG 25693]|uniref:Permease n=1 Tax=Malaciobacter molluscorum LMG 25693 TaxID=870501 RepID=A0A2G1DG01_9BACT|nr:AEC family transporter [Malaciobacter molluscorum]AXX93590.1 putative permease [Malaciobacter molluscorum LMG 25693]PHO17256.1 transporter [Malaciobacter molluscorum LMG 25693]
MQTILYALLPISFLIFLGYFFKRIEFPNLEFWQYADKFTYYVLFPSLLIYKLSTASLGDINGFAFVSSGVVTLFVLTILLMFLSKFVFLFEGKAFTSVYQGATRFNSYVFLALTATVLGDEGLVLAALLMTFMIPLLNILCIMIFSLYTLNQKIDIISFFKSVVKNPLIIGCVVGGTLNYFGIRLFLPLEKTLGILSSATLPLGLLSVGVGLHIKHIKEVKLELFSSLFIKLAIFPAFIFFIARAFGVQGDALAVLVLFGSMPTASSAYILAKQLGGDMKLMSAIITTETLVSIFSISAILMLFQNYFT